MRYTTVAINGVMVELGYNEGEEVPVNVRLSVGKSDHVSQTSWITRSDDQYPIGWANTAIRYLNRLLERHDFPCLDDEQRSAVYVYIIEALGGFRTLAANSVQSG